ncbi:MAG: hypothetical protein ACOC33_00395 [bacterium]
MNGLVFIIKKIFRTVRNSHTEQVKVNCPVCAYHNNEKEDNKFNLEINLKKRIFHCWKCEYSGRVSYLIKRHGSDSDYDEYSSIYFDSDDHTKKYDDDNDEYFELSLPKEFISFKNANLDDLEHLTPYNYLKQNRRIDDNVINYFDLGFALKGRYKNRIIFPSYDRFGNVNYFIGRSFLNQNPPYLNPNINKDKIIFNERNINWHHTLFIVEGGFDLATIPINTTALLGKSISRALFGNLKYYRPNVILGLDPEAMDKTIKILDILDLLSIKAKYINMKSNIDDIDWIRKTYGKEKIVEILKNDLAENIL